MFCNVSMEIIEQLEKTEIQVDEIMNSLNM
jgi:tetrahydromethanopterin S-methyltransferase subunit B